jgi:peptide/nickel transport system permease protein
MQGFVLMIAIVYALVNLFVDVSYGLIDPRLRRQQ